jgi:hypothetical protein
MPKSQLFALSLAVLAACGGGSDPMTFQQAVDLANQEEAQARMLGVNTPCQQSSQCSVLRFLEPSICQPSTYQVYSTISASAAAASAAAAEEVTLAEQAIALAPPGGACPAVIVAPPVPACVANTCQPS